MIGALAALLYTLPRLVRDVADPALIAICTYFTCSFLSFFLGLDFIWPHIADLFGYKNTTTILIHCIIVVLTAAQLIVLMHWSHPPEAARTKSYKIIGVFGPLLISLIALFAFALPDKRRTAETASLLNLDNPRYAAYLYAYVSVVAIGQIITMRVSIRYAGIAARAWLRRGMWIVAAGAGFILVYCIMRYVEIAGVQAGADMEPWDPLQWLAGDTGSLLELMGWTIPGWGPSLSAARRSIGEFRAYYRLYPLWFALYQANPTIAKEPRPGLAGKLPSRGLNMRLYRRVIEILDGQLALRPFVHPDDADAARERASAAGLDGAAFQAAVEAFQLRAALRAKADGRPASAPADVVPAAPGDDLPSQIRWLTLLADAFARSASGIDAQTLASTRGRRG
ncbi:MAB_1171c family putative transporter [Actinomadura rubrisoli]|uniref:DUF6545 domain-containing protein n=1 Tax=Actinomadura rubrisoli TaxID=2530368 RepID=A0A4R5C0S8_9ACTN|nr:MAB_1171c family putative transporter [Actinomadura rubrisoli]TDD91846.1 hypothetical protein E1298_11405 [Actinomadura rubrisoli]